LLTGKKKNFNDIQQINNDGTLTSNSQIISNSLNNYFLSIIENPISITKNNNPIGYLYQAFKEPLPAIKYQNASTTKIEKIIASLKVKDSHG
jgi:Na+/serine symporter